MTASGSMPAAAALRAAHEALMRGDPATAAAKCREALALGHDDAQTWTLLGTALRTREPVAAEAALRRALERDARFVDAHFHLGNLQREQRRYAEAVIAYETALKLAPGHSSILNNLGLAQEGAGEPGRAEACYRDVVRAHPQHRQALRNLAHLLCRNGQYEEALQRCEETLRAFPDADPTVLVDHGICLQQHLHDHGRAEASYRRALALAPDDEASLVNLGSLLIECGEYDQAAKVLARAVAVDARPLYVSTLLALAHQHLCEWNGLDVLHARVAERIEAAAPEDCLANPFAMLSMPVSASLQQRAAEGWARHWWPVRAPTTPHGSYAARSNHRKLRLGYLSSDFRGHPIAFLLNEVWERHDRAQFETTAYSIGARDGTPLRKRIESAFDRFVDCYDDGAAQTAQRIRDDGVDLLVDLNGYTQGARTGILALRPAPLQISWLGYLGTQGAAWIDYVITDRFVTPEAQQPFFTERALFLPECYCPSDTRRAVAPSASSRVDAGLPRAGFVFCSFNNSYKILPSVFDVWMRLLARIPDSVLWLSPGNATATGNLRREASVRGIDPDRLVFARHVPPSEHLARQVHADLFLDTAPYNAGTTANDALLMGLPVLTCAGGTMASRVAGSQLRAIGLPELVTFDLAEYESRALAIARDPALLSNFRQRLRENRHKAPLFDMARFTRDLESALLAAWQRHSPAVPASTGNP